MFGGPLDETVDPAQVCDKALIYRGNVSSEACQEVRPRNGPASCRLA